MFANYRKKPVSTEIASEKPVVKKTLAIYITHGNALNLKIISRPFLNNEHQLLTTYSPKERQYHIVNIAAINAYGMQINEQPVSEDGLIELINQIKQHSSVNSMKTRLVCDANLGTIAGHNVSPLFHSLINQIRPTSLIPFTETPECAQNAEQELSLTISTHKTVTANIIESNRAESQALPSPQVSTAPLKQTKRRALFGCCFMFQTNAASISNDFSGDQPTDNRTHNKQ